MDRKSLLIDLSILRHPMCGLGQIGLNYGRWYSQHADRLADRLDITLLVPKNYKDAFGPHVHYIVRNDLRREFPILMPYFDIWHAINQKSAFRPKSRRTRYILTIHDVNFLYEKPADKQGKYVKQLQHKCDRATEFTFISHFAQQDTQRFIDLHSKPARVIYNGVENLTGGDQTMPTALADIHDPFFLAIGEVRNKKQIHTLLPMMQRFPDHHLVIAGNDHTPYAKEIQAQIAHSANVHMIGIVTDAERRWLYSHCAALLFPSIAEGFGLPVIEAMQWGRCVFCSDKTSLPEIGGPHAHYFHDFDPDHMAALVRDGLAAHTPEKAKAAQQYAASFSYEKHMESYVNLYLE